ncbi:MAG TPA: hypothetical protein VKR53_20065 [Puia sp.]|nr:hypothetical protein [Puia sp.]
MNINENPEEIWIGLAKVQSTKEMGVLENAKNAYVNVLGLARNKIEFRKKVKDELLKLELTLNRLEEIQIFKDRIKEYSVDKSIHNLAKKINNKNKKILFSTFHTFP